jgi:hypothetical protein
MLIISDRTYPFHPHGYLGLPVTTNNRANTYEITEGDVTNVTEQLYEWPSYINPWSPSQVNEAYKQLITVSDMFCDTLAMDTKRALGLSE